MAMMMLFLIYRHFCVDSIEKSRVIDKQRDGEKINDTLKRVEQPFVSDV